MASKAEPEKLDLEVAQAESEELFSCSSTSQLIHAQLNEMIPAKTKVDISKVAPAGTPISASRKRS